MATSPQVVLIRRALYRLGVRTPYGRHPGDWLAEDPPTWTSDPRRIVLAVEQQRPFDWARDAAEDFGPTFPPIVGRGRGRHLDAPPSPRLSETHSAEACYAERLRFAESFEPSLP